MNIKSKKAKARIVILFFIVGVVLCLPSLAEDPRDTVFYQAGIYAGEKLRGSQPGTADSTVAMYATANDFNIPKDYYDATVQELIVSGNDQDTAENLAQQILFYKFSLYSEAEKAGCIVSDDHVEQVIADTRAGIRNAINKSDYYNYLDGMGISEEAYFESQFENIKMYESISAYKELMFQAFVGTSLNEESNVQNAVYEKSWEEELESIVSLAIDKQDIIILE